MIDVADFRFSAFECETERLHLRLLNAGDEALFCGLYTDADTMRFVSEPLTPERAARSFRYTLQLMQQQPPAWLVLAIHEKTTRKTIGACAIPHLDCNAAKLEVGILLRSEARASGFGKEALTALIDRAFVLLAVDEIWVEFSPDNHAIEGTAISLGFKPDADKTSKEMPSSKRGWFVLRNTWRHVGRSAEHIL